MLTCRTYLRNHAINNKFEFRQKTNNNYRIDLRCKYSSCKWRVYVRKLPNELIVKLRIYEKEHTCKSDENCKNTNANAKWVATEIKDWLRNHKDFKPKDVITEIWHKYDMKLSYHSTYKARIIAHENIFGKYDEGYKL